MNTMHTPMTLSAWHDREVTMLMQWTGAGRDEVIAALEANSWELMDACEALEAKRSPRG